MTLQTTVDSNQIYADDLREFTRVFFSYFGAQLETVDSQPGLLSVRLEGPLAEHFGKSSLVLRFHHSIADESELVAFGSRVFDRMVDYLNQHGAVTVLRLPRRHTGGEELLKAIQPTNAGIAGLKMNEKEQLCYAFNWHITYRADDKLEELFTVLLDADGDYIGPVSNGAENGGPGGEDLEDGTDSVSLETMLADAESIAIEHDEKGALISPSLPPMTRLRQYAEIARKYAIYHADLRCITLEGEVLPRLHKTLSRLKIYYDQQIEEVYDAHDLDGEKRRMLERDLERKINEEIDNHRLRVNAQLFSYALVAVPTATADITLSDGKRSAEVHVHRNLYDGTLERPECFACGQQTTLVALDRNGHITCDDCIRQCGTCQEVYCEQCGVATCPVCGCDNCEDCSAECWACGERACREHVDRCPVCGDTVCFSCQTECACCGRRQCRTHLRIDAVVAEGAEPELICPDCAVRCPGCRQFSAHLGLCDASGQRFCENCLVTCVKCGCQVGAGFYALHPLTGNPHCNACSINCGKCGAIIVEKMACTVCGADGCPTCSQFCEVCNRIVCADHAVSMPGCDHVVCTEHVAECCVGGEPLCPICDQPCGICERHYCEEHSDVCTRCRRQYCAECVRRSGLCDTCATHDRDGVFVTLVDEPCAADDRVVYLLPHYRWMRTRNERYTLYLGRNREMSAALIVVENRPDGDPGDVVLLARRLGVLDSKYRERWL